ncbi:MAG: phosphatidylserine decarboxylase [Cyclobacteriaceae bacterium]
MYKSTNPFNFLCFWAFVTFSACTPEAQQQQVEYGKATLELIELLEQNPEVKTMLEKSIAMVKTINPDRNTNPAQSLEAYFEFVSWAEKAMPWALLKKEEYPEIYDNILQGICYFYFINDQPLPELADMDLFNNSLQYAEPYASWIRSFSKSWGEFLDSEASWNEEYYQTALNDKKFGLQNDWYEDPANWKTFNQFFARHLKSPEVRPIASPDDDSIVASFADSQPMGTWAIDSNSNIVQKEGVPVKSATLNSIEKLIGEDNQFKTAFAGGTFTHSFLNVNDYHRYHFPMSGTVKEVRIIEGINPSGAVVYWDAENNRYAFDPSLVGWQMVETRGCVIIETEAYGLVALLPIGMATVNSVNFEDYVQPGYEAKKGDMLGYFLFGGSDFIMLFQDGVNFTIDVPLEEGEDFHQHILMGEQLGHLE